MTNAHSFSFTSIEGQPLPMSSFKGKAVLVVNTASECGLTPQYKGLEALWKARKDKGLVVLGVPSNDFGAQEPGGEKQIKEFCEMRYGVDFPLTSKEHVIGGSAHPMFKWIAGELGEGAAPKWNFHKYLIGKDGSIAGTFGSRTEPDAAELTQAIDAALK
ncbi:MAG: glutathione peroxidase [Alphaproteobacteria bacterium]|nr:glutathione peroxidase [Alphaproteobacteria bacterium]